MQAAFYIGLTKSRSFGLFALCAKIEPHLRQKVGLNVYDVVTLFFAL